jgi:putative oligomerization/nucleic acid binding protein
MPLRRRPLMRAAMVGGAGYAVGKRRAASAEQQQAQVPPPQAQPLSTPPAGSQSSETDRIDALTKLKALLDSGVLTQEQYESERQRLTAGM